MEDKRKETLEAMEKALFDSSTDISSFIFQYFPSLNNKKTELERYWKDLTYAALEEAIRTLCQDSKKHTLLESYEYIEQRKDDQNKQSILSTVRTMYLK